METRLATVLQHMLADTGDINVNHHDVWDVLTSAKALQFSMATSSDLNRAQVVGPQLWAASTVLGDAALPARRIVLAIQSETTPELEMDELTQLLEDVVRRTGQEAEIVFGHGLNPALGDGIQVLMLVSRY
jgi:cell division protein FtsZ